MPVEIRELHIRVAVTTPASGAPASAPSSGGGPDTDAAREALVAECVEQVLRILEQKGER